MRVVNIKVEHTCDLAQAKEMLERCHEFKVFPNHPIRSIIGQYEITVDWRRKTKRENKWSEVNYNQSEIIKEIRDLAEPLVNVSYDLTIRIKGSYRDDHLPGGSIDTIDSYFPYGWVAIYVETKKGTILNHYWRHPYAKD